MLRPVEVICTTILHQPHTRLSHQFDKSMPSSLGADEVRRRLHIFLESVLQVRSDDTYPSPSDGVAEQSNEIKIATLDQLDLEIRRHRNSLCRINLLPIEILQRILEFASMISEMHANVPGAYYKILACLATVSKFWNVIITSSPDFWRILPLYGHASFLELIMARAKTKSLDVFIDSTRRDRSAHLAFNTEVWEQHTPSAELANQVLFRARSICFKSSNETLPFLDIFAQDVRTLDIEDAHSFSPQTIAKWQNPNLTVLSLRKCDLLDIQAPGLDHLRHLSLNDVSGSYGALRGVLKTCPRLQSLHIGPFRARRGAADFTGVSSDIIALLELRSIRLQGFSASDVESLLGCIDCPSCKQYRVQLANRNPLSILHAVGAKIIPALSSTPRTSVVKFQLHGDGVECRAPTASLIIDPPGWHQIDCWSDLVLMFKPLLSSRESLAVTLGGTVKPEALQSAYQTILELQSLVIIEALTINCSTVAEAVVINDRIFGTKGFFTPWVTSLPNVREIVIYLQPISVEAFDTLKTSLSRSPPRWTTSQATFIVDSLSRKKKIQQGAEADKEECLGVTATYSWACLEGLCSTSGVSPRTFVSIVPYTTVI